MTTQQRLVDQFAPATAIAGNTSKRLPRLIREVRP
jgi:hypothetical protein